jgi:hypothetical protein
MIGMAKEGKAEAPKMDRKMNAKKMDRPLQQASVCQGLLLKSKLKREACHHAFRFGFALARLCAMQKPYAIRTSRVAPA